MDKLLAIAIMLLGMGLMSSGFGLYQQTKRIDELTTKVEQHQVVIDKLNEQVGEANGKKLNRIDTYDIVSGVVIESIKQGQKQ